MMRGRIIVAVIISTQNIITKKRAACQEIKLTSLYCLTKLTTAWCGENLSDGEMGILVMLFFKGPDIEHVGENSHIVNDLVELAG